jgi:hypothetical protein
VKPMLGRDGRPPCGLTSYLQFRLALLDLALTGRPWGDVLHTARNQKFDLDKDTLYYLSDGGYSRLVVAVGEGKQLMRIALASGARQEVFAQWGHCRRLVEDVRDAGIAEMTELGWLKKEAKPA